MKVNGKIDSADVSALKSSEGRGVEGSARLKKGITAEGAQNPEAFGRVDLSERAQMMKKAKEIASASSVDEAKVSRLQKLIDEGQYRVDAEAVADRLVDEHLAFPE